VYLSEECMRIYDAKHASYRLERSQEVVEPQLERQVGESFSLYNITQTILKCNDKLIKYKIAIMLWATSHAL